MTDTVNEAQPAKRTYTRKKTYSYGNNRPYHAFSVLFYDPKELELVKKESAESLDAEDVEISEEISEVTNENTSKDTTENTIAD